MSIESPHAVQVDSPQYDQLFRQRECHHPRNHMLCPHRKRHLSLSVCVCVCRGTFSYRHDESVDALESQKPAREKKMTYSKASNSTWNFLLLLDFVTNAAPHKDGTGTREGDQLVNVRACVGSVRRSILSES